MARLNDRQWCRGPPGRPPNYQEHYGEIQGEDAEKEGSLGLNISNERHAQMSSIVQFNAIVWLSEI